MTVSVQVAVAVAAPVDRVWRLLTDWERQSDWVPLTSVWSEDGDRVGGRIFARTGIGRVGFLDSMEISRFDPPRRCEVRHTGQVVRGLGVFRVDPVDDGRTRVGWEEHVEPPFGAAGRLGFMLVRPLVRLSLWWTLRRFARLAARLPT
jgi:carbon monoxide dehydrogenase subunit G